MFNFILFLLFVPLFILKFLDTNLKLEWFIEYEITLLIKFYFVFKQFKVTKFPNIKPKLSQIFSSLITVFHFLFIFETDNKTYIYSSFFDLM